MKTNRLLIVKLILGIGLALSVLSVGLQVLFIRWIDGSTLIKSAQSQVDRSIRGFDSHLYAEWGKVQGTFGFGMSLDRFQILDQRFPQALSTLRKANFDLDFFPSLLWGDVQANMTFSWADDPLDQESSLVISAPLVSLIPLSHRSAAYRLDFSLRDLNLAPISPYLENRFTHLFASDEAFRWEGWLDVEGEIQLEAKSWKTGQVQLTLRDLKAVHPELYPWSFLPVSAQVEIKDGQWGLNSPVHLESIDGLIRMSLAHATGSQGWPLALRFNLPPKQQAAVLKKYACHPNIEETGTLVLSGGRLSCL